MGAGALGPTPPGTSCRRRSAGARACDGRALNSGSKHPARAACSYWLKTARATPLTMDLGHPQSSFATEITPQTEQVAHAGNPVNRRHLLSKTKQRPTEVERCLKNQPIHETDLARRLPQRGDPREGFPVRRPSACGRSQEPAGPGPTGRWCRVQELLPPWESAPERSGPGDHWR